jgi:hypothetical protein
MTTRSFILSLWSPVLLLSIATAFMSVMAFDFFFVPPHLTFAVQDTQYLITFAGLFTVGVVISSLVAKAQAQAEAVRTREAQTASLYALSRDLASVAGVEAVAQSVLRHVEETLDAQVAVLLPEEKVLEIAASSPGLILGEKEKVVAQWAFQNNQPAGLVEAHVREQPAPPVVPVAGEETEGPSRQIRHGLSRAHVAGARLGQGGGHHAVGFPAAREQGHHRGALQKAAEGYDRRQERRVDGVSGRLTAEYSGNLVGDVEGDALLLKTNLSAMDQAGLLLNIFLQYDFPKQEVTLQSAYMEATRQLERTQAKARSALMMAEVNLKTREAALKIQQDHNDRVNKQIAACTIHATQPGMVVYSSTSDPWRRGQDKIQEGSVVRERQLILAIPDANAMPMKTRLATAGAALRSTRILS